VVPTEKAGAASGVTLAVVIGVAGLSVAIVTAIIDGLVAGGTSQGDAIESIWRVAAIASAVLGVALGLAAQPTSSSASGLRQ
jgi:hypothetical protein